ncbi:unnamed protein product [Peronospora belbahrii]|uniref:Uncharacterized protein n=1 Tax=Peronospora belbahrii TaxID=622444 RepID=A0ABN8CX76_9STRA|nr:unnamed protein product [Peronospora belbahrii]
MLRTKDVTYIHFASYQAQTATLDTTYEPYHVGFSTGKLGGLAKQWAFTCGASLQDAFPTCADLKVQMTRQYAPPNQAHHPMPEAVTVTVFIEGLQVGVARTEVFRVNPFSFEEAVGVAWNVETNFKAAWPATYNYSSVPMD